MGKMTIQNKIHSWSSGSITRVVGLPSPIIYDGGPTSDTTSLWPIANYALEVCNAWNSNHEANVCTKIIGSRKDYCPFHSTGSLAKVRWVAAEMEQTIESYLTLVDYNIHYRYSPHVQRH
jgi:hypothetical protein